MPILNVTCPICTETFKNSDDVYSTSCGHLFHFICMRDWQSRSTSCPQCRTYNPQTHKLYLSFDDADENPTELNNLKAQLQSSNEQIQKLDHQIREGDANFLHLQEQCTTLEELVKGLENRNVQSSDSEANFLSLHGQYSITEELNKELQESIQLLSIEIENKSKELQLKALENATLKVSLEAVENQESDTILNEKVRILEQKLKLLTSEFEKEIANSTQLSIDKMKLQSFIDRTKLDDKIKEIWQEENAHNSIRSVSRRSSTNTTTPKGNNFMNSSVNHEPTTFCVSHLRAMNELHFGNALPGRQNQDTDSTRSVVVKDYPLNQITYPLENIIVALATKINLSISKEDLCKVNILESNKHRTPPKKVTICIEFKTLDLKNQFLSNKNRLKNDSTAKHLIIKEHIDDLTYSVFAYANKKLRGNGFNYIFCRNNQVFAKRQQRDAKETRIYSKNQVDYLFKSILSSRESTDSSRNRPSSGEPTVSSRLYEDKVDECYYKI